MTKKIDYAIGILTTLFICILWALPFFNVPLLNLITISLLVVFSALYMLYIKTTQFIYLSRILIIPLVLWFVTAKDSPAFINIMGFICVFACCLSALIRYLQAEQKSAVN